MKKYFFLILGILLPVLTYAQEVKFQESLKKLSDGNKRYVAGTLKTKDFSAERTEQSKGQKPYAIVLTCADSRVSPEVLFDESLGQIFVVRVAGNVVDPVVLGSIEYAAEHLKVPLVVVLGHTKCGAVTATIDGGEAPKNINSLVERIAPAVKKAKSKGPSKEELLDRSIEENVHLQVENALRNSKILSELREEGKLKIVGGIYNIESGKVQFYEYKVEEK